MENCKNCKHLRTLWHWDNYPHGKMNGWCCVALLSDLVVMQLYSIDGVNDFCECWEGKE